MPLEKRYFGFDSFVSVCDGNHCDFFEDAQHLSVPDGGFKRIISSRDQHRFAVKDSLLEGERKGNISIKIDFENLKQKILGFGGAFSDSTGIAIKSLSEPAQRNLMRSYFGAEGIEYNLCRIPIGGTDFSTRPYSYDDVEGDTQLNHFALAEEDLQFKIPLIREAKKLALRKINLFGSPWSPPSWMKESGTFEGKGGMIKEMWDPFSNYLVKFVKEYEKKDIPIWGLTTMNEPLAGLHDWKWNCCAVSATEARNWLKTSLGPILKKEDLQHLNLMIYEAERDSLRSYTTEILRDPDAARYVDGITIHWYHDYKCGPQVLEETHMEFPDKFLLYTEACEGTDGELHDRVHLGSWARAENYAYNIIDDLNHYVSGWVDWNMALDMKGGPNWANNFVDAPIIVNAESDEFYKQPMFYAMGHFSKFLYEGSRRLAIEIEGDVDSVKATVFKNPDGSYCAIILNKGDGVTASINTPSKKVMNITLESKTIETLLFK